MTTSSIPSSPARQHRTAPRAWALLGLAIAVEVTASLSLSAAQRTPVLFIVVVLGYSASLALLGVVLAAGMPVGVAYGVWGATGVMLTAVLAHLIFGDPLTPIMFAGIVLVIIGVLTIELGSQRARAQRARADAHPEGAS